MLACFGGYVQRAPPELVFSLGVGLLVGVQHFFGFVEHRLDAGLGAQVVINRMVECLLDVLVLSDRPLKLGV